MFLVRRTLFDNEMQIGPDGRGHHNGYEFVDLGLPSGILWATCNFRETTEYYSEYLYLRGAQDPFDSQDTYDSINGTNKDGTSAASFTTNGHVDPCNAIMGGLWRYPTANNFKELIDNTTCSTGINDVGGVYVRLESNILPGRYIIFPMGVPYYLYYSPTQSWRKNDNHYGYWTASKRNNAYIYAMFDNGTPYCSGVDPITRLYADALCVRPCFLPE